MSKFTRDLYQLLEIKTNPSTAYHLQTDGQTEHINQEVEQYLWLSTSFSPFYLNYGQHSQKSTEPQREVETEAADVFAKQMKKIREEAAAALEKAASDMKRYYDEGRQDAPEYQVGDKVYLEGSNISTNRPSKKLDDR